jgi:hypothetical protein
VVREKKNLANVSLWSQHRSSRELSCPYSNESLSSRHTGRKPKRRDKTERSEELTYRLGSLACFASQNLSRSSSALTSVLSMRLGSPLAGPYTERGQTGRSTVKSLVMVSGLDKQTRCQSIIPSVCAKNVDTDVKVGAAAEAAPVRAPKVLGASRLAAVGWPGCSLKGQSELDARGGARGTCTHLRQFAPNAHCPRRKNRQLWMCELGCRERRLRDVHGHLKSGGRQSKRKNSTLSIHLIRLLSRWSAVLYIPSYMY